MNFASSSGIISDYEKIWRLFEFGVHPERTGIERASFRSRQEQRRLETSRTSRQTPQRIPGR